MKRLLLIGVLLAAGATAVWWLRGGSDDAVPVITAKRPLGLLQSVPESCAWEPVSGAHLYQLTVFDRALQVLGTSYTNHTPGPLGPAVRQRLKPGGLYYWQVVALDGGGQVLGSSKATAFQLP